MDGKYTKLRLVTDRDPGPGRDDYRYADAGVFVFGVHTRDLALAPDHEIVPPADSPEIQNLAERSRAVHQCLIEATGLRPNIRLDRLAVMPAAVRGIVVIRDCPRFEACEKISHCSGRGSICRAPCPGVYGKPATAAVEAIVEHFKMSATRALAIATGRIFRPDEVWQKGHFERPVRNGRELDLGRRFVAGKS